MKGLIYSLLFMFSIGGGVLMALPTNDIEQQPIQETTTSEKENIEMENKEMDNNLSLTKEFLLKSYESSNEAFEKLHLNDINKLDDQIALEYLEEFDYWLNELNELTELFKKNLPYEEFKIVEFRKLTLLKDKEAQEQDIIHQYEGTQLLNLMLNRFRSVYAYEICKILVNEYM